MSLKRRILVPVDLDENAASVVAWAVLMSRAMAGRMTLLHVDEVLSAVNSALAEGGDSLDTAVTLRDLRAAYDQTASSELSQLKERFCAGLAVDLVLLDGRAYVAILDYLKKGVFDLVVMGTHGRPWYQQVFIGSTAQAVIRAGRAPVLVVNNAAASRKPPGLKKLLVPTDLSAGGTIGLQWARQLATYGSQEITLVHIVENPMLDVYRPDEAERRLIDELRQHASPSPFPLTAVRKGGPMVAQYFWDNARKVSEVQLAGFESQFGKVSGQVERVVREGQPAEEILKLAEEKDVDLIVMATHGRGAAGRLRFGSVTEKIIRGVCRPIFAVKEHG